MTGFGFSLKGLLAVVTFAAIGLTALFNPSQVWESVIGLVTAIFLLTALVAAICSRGQRRAFWIGCSVFAWGYLFLSDNPLRDNVRHPRLLTHVALDALHDARFEELSTLYARARGESSGLLEGRSVNIQRRHAQMRSSLRRTGHYLFAWFFGAVGGFVGSFFYLDQERSRAGAMSRLSH